MLSKSFLHQAEQLARAQSKQYGVPIAEQIDQINGKALELASKLGADPDIVLAGALLMDCQLGAAMAQNKLAQHSQMAAAKAKTMFAGYPEIDQTSQNKIIACILEHHGAQTFACLESEVCCNADCYRFASVEGFILSVRYLRDMTMPALIDILRAKVAEKKAALTLPTCIKELTPQYQVIEQLLAQLPTGGSAEVSPS